MVPAPAARQALLDADAWPIRILPDESGSAGTLPNARVGAVLVNRLVADYRTRAPAQVVVHVKAVLIAALVALGVADTFAPRVPQEPRLAHALRAHAYQRGPRGFWVAETVSYTSRIRHLVASTVRTVRKICFKIQILV